MTRRHGRRRRALGAVLAAVLPLLASCGAPSAPSQPVVVQLPTPVRAPVWSRDTGQLLALAENAPRIVAIDPAARDATVSPDLLDAGDNLGISPTVRQVAYLPQPALGQVSVVDIATLRPVGTLAVGSSPAEVAVDVGSELLYSLSRDGTTVTGVDVGRDDVAVFPPVPVQVGDPAMLDGPQRGRPAGFFVAGPQGVALYEGQPRARRVAGIDVPAAAAAGDPIQVTRLYLAEAGSDRLVAVGLDPRDERLTVLAQARLGAPVRYVGADTTRIYAATQDRLTVFRTNTFEGFPDRRFEVVGSVDFRRTLPPAAARAPLSGLAVGPATDRVYLTLQGQPYLLSIAKPDA